MRAPREAKLSILLARTPLSREARSRIAGEIAKGIDWNLLLDYTARWKIEPVVCSNLTEFFSEEMDAETLSGVIERKRISRAMALTKSIQTVEIVNRLEEKGIDVLVLKGAGLAVSAYDDASLRTSDDIDILVRKSDLGRARDFLVAANYSPAFDTSTEARLIRNQDALSFTNGRTLVDVHWALLSRHLRMDFDADSLWNSSRTIPCAGSHIRVLSRVHEFLFLCAHGAKHEWMSVRWIIDAAQAGSRLNSDDEQALIVLAGDLRAERLLRLCVRLAHDIAGATGVRLERFSSAPDVDRQVRQVETQLFGTGTLPKGLRLMWRIEPQLAPLFFWSRSRESRVDRYLTLLTVIRNPLGLFRRAFKGSRMA